MQDNRPQRKKLRLSDYDYAQAGYYFITFCTHHKRPLFAKIENKASILNAHGAAVERVISTFLHQDSNVFVDKYVIMPNHIHMIVILRKTDAEATIPDLSDVIKFLKSCISKELHKSGLILRTEPIWQRSYYDHIIRNQQEYFHIWEYIDVNPLRWESDEHYVKT